jgi:hypothetical protein
MTQAMLVHLDKENADSRELAMVELDVIPRIGERVRFLNTSEDNPIAYIVDNVVHSFPAEHPLEIWLVSAE